MDELAASKLSTIHVQLFDPFWGSLLQVRSVSLPALPLEAGLFIQLFAFSAADCHIIPDPPLSRKLLKEMDDAEGQSAVPASSGAPAATGAPDALQWTQAVQQWQAQAQAMQGGQQRKNGAQAAPPFYPLGAAHPYSLYQVFLGLIISGASGICGILRLPGFFDVAVVPRSP